jgi:hypothetical protein
MAQRAAPYGKPLKQWEVYELLRLIEDNYDLLRINS